MNSESLNGQEMNRAPGARETSRTAIRQVDNQISKIDPELCTGCQTCVEPCPADAITGEKRQPHTISEERCVACGRCVQLCNAYDAVFQEHATTRTERLKGRGLPLTLSEPLFAAYDRSSLADVQAALADPSRMVVAQCGPAVGNAIAEDFGLEPGAVSSGRLVAAIRRLGFGKVFSVGLGAALALLEESRELLERLKSGRILPVINSSCPAAVKFIEQFYPELIYHLAGSKSPQGIAGALSKTYVSEMLHVDPSRIYSVSIGPCTSRKFEAGRRELKTAGGAPDVDAALTTRELAWLIKASGIDLRNIPEAPFDQELAEFGVAASVYSVAGRVSQAVLLLAHREAQNGAEDGKSEMRPLEQTETEGIRAITAQIGSHTVKAVVATGLKNAAPLFEAIRSGRSDLSFLEVLACPNGCVSGGGQPKGLLPHTRDGLYEMRVRSEEEVSPEQVTALADHAAIADVYRHFGSARGDRSNRALQTEYMERRLNK